jgi:hypothetical protein
MTSNSLHAAERRKGVAEIGALGGAAGRVVLGVEVQNELRAALALQSEGVATGAGEAEVRDRLALHFQVLKTLLSNSP